MRSSLYFGAEESAVQLCSGIVLFAFQLRQGPPEKCLKNTRFELDAKIASFIYSFTSKKVSMNLSFTFGLEEPVRGFYV